MVSQAIDKKWLLRFEEAAKKNIPNYQKSLWSSRRNHLNRINLFLELFNKNIKNKPKVLDVGCGPGEYCSLIANKCEQVIGMDFSYEILRIAKKDKKHKNLNYIKGDINNLPFENNSFDVVASIGLLQCIKEYKQGIKEMDRVLKQNGFLIVSTLRKPESLLELFPLFVYLLLAKGFNFSKMLDIVKNRGFFKKYGDKMVVRHNPFDMKSFLKKNGYKNIRIYYLDPAFARFSSNEFIIIAHK